MIVIVVIEGIGDMQGSQMKKRLPRAGFFKIGGHYT